MVMKQEITINVIATATILVKVSQASTGMNVIKRI